MKKLIAIAVVFALVVGTAFAVDLSADVDAFANVFEYSNAPGAKVKASADFDAIRLSGAGELADGKFGGNVRLDFVDGGVLLSPSHGVLGQGLAWWKPIDQFKLTLGQSNAKGGMGWGKEGVTGWGFNQKAYGTHVALGSDNVWGRAWGGFIPGYLYYRDVFAADIDENTPGLYMEIKPFDMLGINIGFKDFNGDWGRDFFADNFVFQVDLNFAFGNIALTMKEGSIFMYYGGSFGAISLDIGLSVPDLVGVAGTTFSFYRIYFGAGLKYSAGAFGIKFRTATGIPANSLQTFDVLFDVLPYFQINDNFSVFVNAGMGMVIKNGLKELGWAFNPYIRIGAEWGPSFYVGIQAGGKKGGNVDFALPIGITVGF